MSDIKNVFDIAGRAMSAQMTRMNTVASNLANANALAGSEAEAFRALRPVFATEFSDQMKSNGVASVNVDGIVQLNRAPDRIYQPDNPIADKDGYVYQAAVDTDEEMVEMLEASRQYQNNLEVVSTLRTLMARTVTMGQ